MDGDNENENAEGDGDDEGEKEKKNDGEGDECTVRDDGEQWVKNVFGVVWPVRTGATRQKTNILVAISPRALIAGTDASLWQSSTMAGKEGEYNNRCPGCLDSLYLTRGSSTYLILRVPPLIRTPVRFNRCGRRKRPGILLRRNPRFMLNATSPLGGISYIGTRSMNSVVC